MSLIAALSLLTGFAAVLLVAYLLARIGLHSGAKTRQSEPELLREETQKLIELETRMKAVELEWENAYDKLTRLTNRLTKERALTEHPRTIAVAGSNTSRAGLLIRKPPDAG